MAAIEGKWALVTGSSRGIGQQIALGLAQRGCNVVVHGREASHAAKTVELLRDFRVQTRIVAGELSTAAGVQAVIDAAKADPGQIDILYNNAAIVGRNSDIYQFTQDDWDEVFRVNVWALI